MWKTISIRMWTEQGTQWIQLWGGVAKSQPGPEAARGRPSLKLQNTLETGRNLLPSQDIRGKLENVLAFTGSSENMDRLASGIEQGSQPFGERSSHRDLVKMQIFRMPGRVWGFRIWGFWWQWMGGGPGPGSLHGTHPLWSTGYRVCVCI